MPGHAMQAGLTVGVFDSEGKFFAMGPGGPVLMAWGANVPKDGEPGYATGCTFKHVDGGPGDALYVNEGTGESCNFVAK